MQRAIEALESRRLLSTVLYNADFENTVADPPNDGFDVDASPTGNLWHLSSVRYQSPGHAMYYGQDATRNYDTGDWNVGTITSHDPISLAGQTSATLSFRYFLSAEPLFPGDPLPPETIKLEITSDNGVNWTELANSGNTIANDALWHNWSTSLSAYLGQSVKLRFTFDTIDNLGNSNEGWFIDDINVYGGTDLPPTVTSITPTDADEITTSSSTFQYVFSENVSGVDTTDLLLSGSAAGSATVSSVTMGANATIWNFQVTGLTNGLLNVTLAPDAGDIVDSAAQSLLPVTSRYGVYLPDRYESNETFATATNLGALGGTLAFNNMSLHTATDVDYYQFTPEASGSITITADYHVNVATAYVIEVYDNTQTQVTNTNPDPIDNAVTFNATQGSTYYIKIYSFESGYPLHSYDLSITAPNVAPRVSRVYVRGTGWNTNYLNFLGANIANSSDTYGYAIPTGTTQMQTLPWININQISVQFDEPVNVSQSQISFVGAVQTYATSGFAYNAADRVATWTLSAAMAYDNMYITLPGGGAAPITDAGGAALDGEWTNSSSTFPSGNGTAGGDFVFRMAILPGDVNGSNAVNVTDVTLTKTRSLQALTTTNYRSDVNASGAINVTDVTNIKTRSLTSLPPAPAFSALLISPGLLLSSSRELLS